MARGLVAPIRSPWRGNARSGQQTAMAPAPDQAKAQLSQLSDFTFIDEIGHGSFGTVHKVKRKGECRLRNPSSLVPLMPAMQRMHQRR